MPETTDMIFKKIGYSSENGKKKLSVITNEGKSLRIEIFGSFNPDKYPDNQWYSAAIKIKQGERMTFYDLKVVEGQEPLKLMDAPTIKMPSYKSNSEDGYDRRMALGYAVQTLGIVNNAIDKENAVSVIKGYADEFYKWLREKRGD